MSEINSIANGTYTIGQTSATNFIAGPGISIDSPSAGTVRIGNDETVLWENTAWPGSDKQPGVNTASLSESVYNFNSIKIYGSRNAYNAMSLLASNCNEFDTSIVNSQSGRCILYSFFLSNNNAAPFDCWTVLKFDNGTSFTEISGGQKPLTGSVDYSMVYYHPYKIVGINRISGGNE